MPGKRPDEDGLAIWLIVQVWCDGKRGMLESAYQAISDWLKPFPFRNRARGPFIDTETGIIFGDKLSVERVKALYKKVGKRRVNDSEFERATSAQLAELKSLVAAKPGSRLLPFRNSASNSRACEWVIAQYWPGAPLEQRISIHLPHKPPEGYGLKLEWVDQPKAKPEVEWSKIK